MFGNLLNEAIDLPAFLAIERHGYFMLLKLCCHLAQNVISLEMKIQAQNAARVGNFEYCVARQCDLCGQKP